MVTNFHPGCHGFDSSIASETKTKSRPRGTKGGELLPQGRESWLLTIGSREDFAVHDTRDIG
jgi:hypothetical protein